MDFRGPYDHAARPVRWRSPFFPLGCNDAGTEAASRGAGQPVPVEALVIAPRAQMLTTDLPGRIAPLRVAEVRARWLASSRSVTSLKVRWSKKVICCSPSSPLHCRRWAQSRQRRAQAQVKQAESLCIATNRW
ncbi:hypothetical protein J4732_08040 [Serratia marcescens]|uniref:Uncharacterized protein n=1 Tax=Serratia marcescens TaxID=615 RepID=A0A939NNX7_SERMA|nr:hypothetical protein [Serratia marcescens]